MKICFLELQPFPYNIGGGTSHLIWLSKYLIRKGHDVSIITSRPGNNQKALDVPSKLKIYSVGMPHKIFKNEGLFSSVYALFYRTIWELSWIFVAKKKLKEVSPDVCNPQSLITTALPCSISGRPFVASLYGVYLDGFRKLWRERDSKTVLLLSKVYEFLENFNGRKAKFLICVNSSARDYYAKKFGRDKCVTIPVGIDPEDFKNVSSAKKKDYLFMGRLTEQKGLSYLIDALKILDKEKTKITLNVVGEGEENYVRPLKEKTLRFKTIKVNFLGNVVGKKKIQLYNRTKVFISSSIFESFGIVLVEAMASGCAIISADHEGGNILVKPSYGKIIKFNEENARAKNLAAAIRESFKWNINKMGKAAIKSAGNYYYPVITDRILKVFSSTLNQ